MFALIPFLLPSHAIDRAALRTAYLSNLKSYVGTRYIWGGENRIGIDCSGLPRKSLRMALLSCGLKTGNGGAMRAYAEQWWFDASAKALSQGYRGYTIPLHVSGKIQTLDYSTFEPGDLAVTSNGVHVMVYIGGDLWIQADPGIGKVAVLNGRTDANHWFKVPVTMHRWSVLAG
jgi:cell wall-associated NlpC family hydrolase